MHSGIISPKFNMKCIIMGRYYPNVQFTKCRLPQLAWKNLTDREDISLKANIIPVRINPRMEIILTGHHYQIS